MISIKNINFRQPKYMLPAILYLPVLGALWLFVDLFQTKKLDIDTSGLETTHYINSKLPEAQIKGDGIGDKRSNMQDAFGDITDLSAVEQMDEEVTVKEDYESKYTEEDLLFMLEQQRQIQEDRIRDSLKQAMMSDVTGLESLTPDALDEMSAATRMRREEALQDEVDRAIASIRAQSEKGNIHFEETQEESKTITPNAVTAIDDNEKPQAAVRKIKTVSSYFNSISTAQEETGLIQAIIDEELKAVEGSRVRLRLLDDIEVGELVIPQGTYLYAALNGFGSQRVTGTVESILADGHLIRVDLSIYDTDGLEGLYVPESKFRETSKDVASSAFQNNMSMSTTADGNFNQWAVQGLQNAYQRTSAAISNVIRKNQVTLKYGTIVYLINKNEK